MRSHQIRAAVALVATSMASPTASLAIRDVYQEEKERERLRSNLPPPSGFNRRKTNGYYGKNPTTSADFTAIAAADDKRLRRIQKRELNRQRSIEGQKRALAKLQEAA